MGNKEPMAYDLHYNEIRAVIAKHLNEYPNRLISDLAELIRTKNDQVLEGMVLMTTGEFDEVASKIRDEERQKREEMVEALKDIASVTPDDAEIWGWYETVSKIVSRASEALTHTNNPK